MVRLAGFENVRSREERVGRFSAACPRRADQQVRIQRGGLQDGARIEQLGATVKAQWATLGHFDFVNIVEAPDEKTMTRVSLELSSRGTSHYETLTAIPIDDFIASL